MLGIMRPASPANQSVGYWHGTWNFVEPIGTSHAGNARLGFLESRCTKLERTTADHVIVRFSTLSFPMETKA
jgi:hypothetical protein